MRKLPPLTAKNKERRSRVTTQPQWCRCRQRTTADPTAVVPVSPTHHRSPRAAASGAPVTKKAHRRVTWSGTISSDDAPVWRRRLTAQFRRVLPHCCRPPGRQTGQQTQRWSVLMCPPRVHWMTRADLTSPTAALWRTRLGGAHDERRVSGVCFKSGENSGQRGNVPRP